MGDKSKGPVARPPPRNPGHIRTGPALESKQHQVTSATTDVFQCCKGGQCNLHGGDRGFVGPSWSITNMPPEISKYAIDEMVRVDRKVYFSQLIN